MKECLNCKVDISGKASSSKFCSTNCRVYHHRKNGKAKGISPIQVQAIYDAIMDKIAAMGDNSQINRLETVFPVKTPKIARSFEYYQQEKINCESVEDWVHIKEMIIEDPNLTQKQKNLLIN